METMQKSIFFQPIKELFLKFIFIWSLKKYINYTSNLKIRYYLKKEQQRDNVCLKTLSGHCMLKLKLFRIPIIIIHANSCDSSMYNFQFVPHCRKHNRRIDVLCPHSQLYSYTQSIISINLHIFKKQIAFK